MLLKRGGNVEEEREQFKALGHLYPSVDSRPAQAHNRGAERSRLLAYQPPAASGD